MSPRSKRFKPSQNAHRRRADGIAVAEALLVRTHPGVVALLVVAREVRGDREPLQVLDLEGVRTDTGEARECVTPLAALEALACRVSVSSTRTSGREEPIAHQAYDPTCGAVSGAGSPFAGAHDQVTYASGTPDGREHVVVEEQAGDEIAA